MELTGIGGLIIVVADIYAIVMILQSSAKGIEKLIWAVVVFFLPLLGLPVEARFLAFGLIMVLMMRFRPAGLLPIPAVAARMRAGRVKRKKVKVLGIAKV